jgi:hypothetical protein
LGVLQVSYHYHPTTTTTIHQPMNQSIIFIAAIIIIIVIIIIIIITIDRSTNLSNLNCLLFRHQVKHRTNPFMSYAQYMTMLRCQRKLLQLQRQHISKA